MDIVAIRPDGTEDTDSRFFITSLASERVSPKEFLKKIRDHWQVENNLHWMKDRYWEEDKHYLKRSGKVFICLTNLALSLLQFLRCQGDSIKSTCEDIHFEPIPTLKMLGFQVE